MISAILLAAGSSSRMGQSKQLLNIGGEILLARTLRTILGANVNNVVVVLGANEHVHRDVIKDFKVDIVSNKSWENGIGSSIKAGLNHLVSKNPTVQGVIISVCDQPRLTSDVIANLISTHNTSGKPIIACDYPGGPGVPVLFDETYFEKLNAIPDDQGAKKLILQNTSDLSLVTFPGGEIDLDTMEDVARYQDHPLRPGTLA